MRPALEPGDRLLVVRWSRLKPGDLVVLRDPESRSTMLVKRVSTIDPINGDVTVGGDNPNVSRDSREFGPVPSALILGKVIYRYLPGERRGKPR
jgi:nickel-type superoxide dismutase maturation protease